MREGKVVGEVGEGEDSVRGRAFVEKGRRNRDVALYPYVVNSDIQYILI